MATFDDVVRLTADLPMVSVGTFYGTPGVKVNGKGFSRMWGEREHTRDGVDDTEVLVLFAPAGGKEMVLEQHEGVCFSTPHYDGHDAYVVRMADIALDDLADLLEESYRVKAPAAALKELDGDASEA